MTANRPIPTDAPREKAFLLAAAEQRVLHAIAGRLARRLMPDHLTARNLRVLPAAESATRPGPRAAGS